MCALKEEKYVKIKYSVFGILVFIAAVLIIACAIYMRRVHIISQSYANMQEHFYEISHANEVLKAEIVEIQEELINLQTEATADPLYYQAIQQILDTAPEKLAYVLSENVQLNPPETFVILPNNRILINGQWFCTHCETYHTIEAIFSFWIWNDEIQLGLRSYSPFGRGTWRDPWQSPNEHSWVRYHAMDIVPVRFYSMGGDRDEVWYNVKYLSGENFSEELVMYALQYLNRRITDAWFVGTILYVNLHHNEPMRMSSGTFGEYAMYSTLVSSMASVPGIDALVIMVDGQREATFGGHGATFSDIYLINTPGTWRLEAESVINISGTWVYVESFVGIGVGGNDEPRVIYEFSISPPYIEIDDNNTLFARFWETRINAILAPISQYEFFVTEQIATSEGEEWRPEDVILKYDTENSLLRWTVFINEHIHHIFTRT